MTLPSWVASRARSAWRPKLAQGVGPVEMGVLEEAVVCPFAGVPFLGSLQSRDRLVQEFERVGVFPLSGHQERECPLGEGPAERGLILGDLGIVVDELFLDLDRLVERLRRAGPEISKAPR